MKKIFTLFSLTLFLSINAQTFKISEYDFPKIVSELFKLGVSTDGDSYTQIDTIFTHNKKKDIVTIAISTHVLDENGEIENCHACGPILSLMSFKIDDARENLQLLYFEPFVGNHGNWGQLSSIEIVQFSENDYFVKVSDFQSGQGSSFGGEFLYYNGNEVLYFESSASIDDWNGGGGYVSWETTMNVDKINRIITLTKKGTEFSEKTRKIIPVNKITKYKISGDPITIVKI